MLNTEFDFKDRDIAIYKHVNERSDGSKSAHFHILVSEQNSGGKTMSNRMNYVRNEKCARALELKFGHTLTQGAHNKAVAQVAPEHAKAALKGLTEGPRPTSALSAQAHQKAKRLNVDLPGIAHELSKLSQVSNIGKGQALAALEDKYNIIFEKGDRRNVILIKDKNGEIISNANKSLNVKAADVTATLTEKRNQRDSEENSRHRADARPDHADESVSVRPGRPVEPRLKSRGSRRPASKTGGATRTTGSQSDITNGSDRTSSERSSSTNNRVQLNDPSAARQRLSSAVMRGAAKQASSKMKFGNSTSAGFLGSIASGPQPLAVDTNDPLYAEKVASAWSASMQSNAPRM